MELANLTTVARIQLFQLRLFPRKAESRIRARKIHSFFSDSQQAFRARIRLFRFARGQP
jgi:hypothetical protein